MQITKIIDKTDKEVTIGWKLTIEQEMYLLNFAIQFLIEKGLISVIEEEMGQKEGQIELDLSTMDISKLPQA